MKHGKKYVEAAKPTGAFYLFIDCSELLTKSYKGKKIETTAELARILIEDYLVAVVPCGDFGFADHIRLSYATSLEAIKKGMDRIEEFINSVK